MLFDGLRRWEDIRSMFVIVVFHARSTAELYSIKSRSKIEMLIVVS
jgi:hypothetical protein